ncbi:hypothetical protein GYMLUDRAFT_64139 [Collybiopsis luxurians FD-317 M1]|uniref:Uncharacterized protein n=1 Tax=Collybiopsis luxurians FD-317 M1 TaxID=944289 RepID=A0A0D0C465_9AGAR|nr:hypothetical protein GYMLUDRAFT_64139 [Collybiopsis luxurians FD-317 M1]
MTQRGERDCLELEHEKLAVQQDINAAFMKEMKDMSLQLGEGLSVLANTVGSMAQKDKLGTDNGTPGAPAASREFLCFMCQSKDYLLHSCPCYHEFLKQGWLVPEGNDSNRVKLKDNQRMPQDDPERLHYQQIEDMAKNLGWDRAEAYFANIEDDSGLEMDRQLNPDILMKGPESEKVDPFRIAKTLEEDTPLSKKNSMFVQKKVTFDGALMPTVNSNQVPKSTTGKDQENWKSGMFWTSQIAI